MSDRAIFLILVLLGVMSATVVTNRASAEERTNSNGNFNFKGDRINSSENYRRTQSQPFFTPNTNRGSQKFFQETQDQIYLLEEKDNSNPLLNIDKTISVDGVSLEDLYLDN